MKVNLFCHSRVWDRSKLEIGQPTNCFLTGNDYLYDHHIVTSTISEVRNRTKIESYLYVGIYIIFLF